MIRKFDLTGSINISKRDLIECNDEFNIDIIHKALLERTQRFIYQLADSPYNYFFDRIKLEEINVELVEDES